MKLVILLIISAALTLPATAETLLYTLEVPEGRSVTYEVPFEPSHKGQGAIVAEWEGHRVLAFRVESPGLWSKKYRRTGPSPQRLEFEIDDKGVGEGPWKLTIIALASNGGGSGTLTLELPDEATKPPPPAPAPEIPAATPADVRPWERPRARLEGLPPTWNRLQDVTEDLRLAVVGRAAPDACSWQSDLLRFATRQLDSPGGVASVPGIETRKLLAEMAETIDLVEQFRTTGDPAIAGPPPRTEKAARAWVIERRERYMTVESRLDGLIRSIRRGHAPGLEGYEWPLRLVSCVTACERHFEERVRLGDERAANRELSEAQWERILLARRLVAALADLRPR